MDISSQLITNPLISQNYTIYDFPICYESIEFQYDINLIHLDKCENVYISLLKNVSSVEDILSYCHLHSTVKIHTCEPYKRIELMEMVIILKRLLYTNSSIVNICDQIRDKYPEFLY